MESLVLKNVTKKFGEKVALNGLSFSCKRGEIVVLLGPTGAGKTTTLRCIAGLEELDGGEISIDNINQEGIVPEHRSIAMFFENYALYPHLTVGENISFPLKAPQRKGRYSAEEIVKRTREVAELLEIEDYLNRKPDQLSGGQRQRTALGRALIRSPKLFLLDEPIAHLDAVLRNRMRGEMKRIFSQIESTVVYVTHDYKEALSIGDRILVMNEGKIVQAGSNQDIYRGMKNMFVARLVGDPPMNFIPARLQKAAGDDGYLLEAVGQALTFSSGEENVLDKWLNKDVVVGIRPHDLEIYEEKRENCLPGKVLTIELMSSSYEYTIRLDKGDIFRVKSDERADALRDKNIWLEVNTNNIHLFNPANEEAIYHGEGL